MRFTFFKKFVFYQNLLFILIIIFFLFCFTLFFSQRVLAQSKNNFVTINKIKIIIDGQLYVWQNPDNIPEKNDNNFTDPLTIISFLDIKPLEEIEKYKLEQKLFNIEKNLMTSGYFFTASAYVVESSKGENFVNVIIEVTEGFLLRFGGGSIFGVFGKDNIYGLRKSFLIAIGYNLDGIKYCDEIFLGLNSFINISLFYQNDYGFTDIKFNKLDFELDFGYRFKPNLKISLDSFLSYQNSNILSGLENYFYDGEFLSISEGIKIQYNYYFFINKTNKSDFYLRGELDIHPSFLFYYGLSDSVQNLPSNPIFLLNIKKVFVLETKYFSSGFATYLFYVNNLLDYFNSYNLSYSQNPFIRTIVAKSQSYPDFSIVTNFELRSPDILIPLGGIFNFQFSIFLFDDFAFCKFLHKSYQLLPEEFKQNELEVKDNFYFLNAIGIGIRFGFGLPINVFFTLTYGFNLNGNGTFILFYGKGF